MSIVERVKSLFGGGDKSESIVGTIVDKPIVTKNGDSGAEVVVFHLDSRPELEFRQLVRPLNPQRQRGDRVKVHCEVKDGIATVGWMEQA